jgi:hypothetical protein
MFLAVLPRSAETDKPDKREGEDEQRCQINAPQPQGERAISNASNDPKKRFSDVGCSIDARAQND